MSTPTAPSTTENLRYIGIFEPSATAAHPGDTITITGRCMLWGAPGDSALALTSVRTETDGYNVARAEAVPARDGRFTMSLTVPLDIPLDRPAILAFDCALGDQAFGQTPTMDFIIVPPGEPLPTTSTNPTTTSTSTPATPTPTTAPTTTIATPAPTPLPETGSPTTPLLGGALLTIAAGATLLAAHRQHRRNQPR